MLLVLHFRPSELISNLNGGLSSPRNLWVEEIRIQQCPIRHLTGGFLLASKLALWSLYSCFQLIRGPAFSAADCMVNIGHKGTNEKATLYLAGRWPHFAYKGMVLYQSVAFCNDMICG